ncbi:zinc finger, ZZ type [Onchocerca flexuosa]|uniref:RING-type E3 ubiquitin transferase n=1 Tax=Onchocerca flexuosa TaxID=387005 RepID=A0A238BIZ7_9BILA|nr:zinc finger, ZZ type [Onchocerca flexuosa]
MSSVHEGVSCDGCMAPNFAGDRYKCLRCYDFDLCSRCYMEERSTEVSSENRTFRETNEEHSPSHPMQCIMTQQDFELAYHSDQTHSWDRLRVVIFTCPVCGLQGLSRERLVSHACPICISTDFYRIGFGDYMPNHLTDMVSHMQEHHMQAQYINVSNNSNSGISDTANVLSEFLRDRDLRRVIVHNVPLVSNDSDVEEPAADGTRRNTSSQRGGPLRVETVSHIRRRSIDRNAVEINQPRETSDSIQSAGNFSPRRIDGQSPAGFSSGNSVVHSPAGLSSGFSNRSNMQSGGFSSIRLSASRTSLQPSRSARDSTGIVHTGNNSLPVSSVIEAPPSSHEPHSELLTDSSAVIRTFQYPITAYSRPTVPSHGLQRNQRTSGENSSRTMGYARRFLVRERDHSRNETLFGAPPGFRRLENVDVSNAVEATPVRIAACSARNCDANDAYLSNSEATDGTVSSTDAHVLVDISYGEYAAQNSSQEALVESIEELERQMERSGNIESKKSLKYCTLFTALAKPSCLPVLKIERVRLTNDDQSKQSDALSFDDDDDKNKDEIPPLRLIMRIGRPLRYTYKQRNQSIVQQQSYDMANDFSDWWSSRFSEHLRTESATRVNRANIDVTPETLDTSLLMPDRSLVSRGEVALNRAIDALRRLDTRHTHSSRLPMAHDGITQTSSSVYLNGNIIPPPGMGSHNGQVLLSALGNTLFLGSDSVADAVAREVAAFSEASGLNIRQLQGLIRREEHIAPNPHLNNRSSSGRFSSIPAPTILSEMRARKSVKVQVKGNEQHDGDYTDFINEVFRATEVDSLLDVKYVIKKRYYKPYDLKTDEQKEAVLIPWLEEQDALDLSVDMSDAQLDGEIVELLKQIPEFVDDELIISGKVIKDECYNHTGPDIEEAMFDSEKGSDEELLIKKCESADLKRSQGPFTIIGIFGTGSNERNEFGTDYWKDYRFLRNRRGVFVLKKSDVSFECMLAPMDHRLIKQLVFGKLDVPMSLYSRTHYLPDIFMRIMRTNLRIFYLSQETKEFLEENMGRFLEEIMPSLENEGNMQWDMGIAKAECNVSSEPLEIPPELWYFLDLASFFDPNTIVLNEQNK